MTPEQRIEAAVYAVGDKGPNGFVAYRLSHDEAEDVLAAAYPELAAGTHVIVPREPTEEMIAEFQDIAGGSRGDAMETYSAMIQAYEAEQEDLRKRVIAAYEAAQG